MVTVSSIFVSDMLRFCLLHCVFKLETNNSFIRARSVAVGLNKAILT
jgi:hypothetical protein